MNKMMEITRKNLPVSENVHYTGCVNIVCYLHGAMWRDNGASVKTDTQNSVIIIIIYDLYARARLCASHTSSLVAIKTCTTLEHTHHTHIYTHSMPTVTHEHMDKSQRRMDQKSKSAR